MPVRQPFTALCQLACRPRSSGRADLHVHTDQSDGIYSPAQVVDLARRSGLAAVAVTDHDTLAGVEPARQAAARSDVEIIAGIEITAEFRCREVHLLGYFVRTDNTGLNDTLERLRAHRVRRFWEMVERLRACGVSLDEGELRPAAASGTLGRRHLAMQLIKERRAGSVREAFSRYLGDNGRVAVPKLRLPIFDAIDLVRAAGGVASWAHPSYDCNRESLIELRGRGLRAVEADYPGFRPSRVRELRSLAEELGLAITAGSDCHGPGRDLGRCSVTAAELEKLRGFSDAS